MSILFIVLPLAILIVALAVGAYVWSARTGQFDDLETPAMRMLHDDEGERGASLRDAGEGGVASRRREPHGD